MSMIIKKETYFKPLSALLKKLIELLYVWYGAAGNIALKPEEMSRREEHCKIRESIICTNAQILLGIWYQELLSGLGK